MHRLRQGKLSFQTSPVYSYIRFSVLSQLIKYSPKRAALLEQLQSQLSTATPTIKPFCPTKCTVHAAAIGFVNYTVLCEALLEIYTYIHDEYSRKVGGFLAQREN